MFKTIFFGLGMGLGLVSCGVSQQPASDTKIVGGAIAQPIDSVTRSTVSLTLTSGGGVTLEPTSFCSGVLIAPGKVVTASSCFKEDIEDLRSRGAILNVVFGQVGTLVGASSRVAKTVTMHPQFKADLIATPTPTEPANDIAIINFEGDVPAGHSAVGVAAPDFTLALSETEVFTIAGYGVSDPNSDVTGILRQGSVKFSSIIDLANVIQFRGTNVAACDGDSGGPAYKMQNGNVVVIGIVSSSNCRTFMRYTDLRKYGSFIGGM